MYNFADSSVTASAFTSGANTALTLVATTAGLTTTAALVIYYDDQLASTTVTVSSLPAIAGTVTANVDVTSNIAPGISDYANNYPPFPVIVQYGHLDFVAGIRDGDGSTFGVDRTFPVTISDPLPAGSNLIGQVQISGQITSNIAAGTARIGVVTIGGGTVTIGAGTQQIGSVTASISGTVPISISSVTVGNSVTIGSLPALAAGTAQIGSVTASILANPSGALTTRFGSVTTANTAQITTAVTNTSRKYLFAQNISIGSVTMGIGFSPTTTQGIQLSAGSGIVFDSFCPTGAVYWLGATTGAAWSILEG
jgi:hypothetical protein